ncbi:hypothetical protein N2152v2_008682 [Parachlorella kessleri]
MVPAFQAALPRSLRTLSLSLNLGSVLLLGSCAGKAAAIRIRKKHSEAAAGEAPAAAAEQQPALGENSSSSSSSSHSSSVWSSSPSSGLAVRLRRPSRWLRDQPLYRGSGAARGFASMPCPVSDDEDDFEWEQEDLVDLRWQYLWQQQQEAYLAAAAAQQRAAQAKRASAGHLQGSVAAAASVDPLPSTVQGPQLEQPQPQRQPAQHVSVLTRDAHSVHITSAVAVLPWERLGEQERQRQLAAYHAECQPYTRRSMHSMTLPFLLEAYSMALPPLEEAAVVYKPPSKAGRPRKQQDAGYSLQQHDWQGGAPSTAVGQALRRVLPVHSHAALDEALARFDACFKRSGEWSPNHGPAQLRSSEQWRVPDAQRAAKVASFLTEEAGATVADVLAVIASSPWVLGIDPRAQARPTLQLLQRYGIGNAQGEQTQEQQATEAASQEASMARQQQQQQQQQQEQCPSPAGRLLTARPVLMLQSPTEHLQPILQYLLSDLGFTPAQTDRLLRDNAVLCGPEGPARLQLVVSFLAGKGLSREEVRHVLAQVPRVLQYTVPQLQIKWQYMEQALGGGSKDIAACPYFLETSLTNVLGPRVSLAHAQGVPILLPSRVEGEGQRRGGLKRASKARGLLERESGISLWKLLRDSSSKLAVKLGTTAEEFQLHMHQWQRHEAGRWQQLQPRELEHYMQLRCSSFDAHLATHQRCCSY